MAQWSTLMPCNREAAGSNLCGFGFFLKGAHYEVDYSGKKLTKLDSGIGKKIMTFNNVLLH